MLNRKRSLNRKISHRKLMQSHRASNLKFSKLLIRTRESLSPKKAWKNSGLESQSHKNKSHDRMFFHLSQQTLQKTTRIKWIKRKKLTRNHLIRRTINQSLKRRFNLSLRPIQSNLLLPSHLPIPSCLYIRNHLPTPSKQPIQSHPPIQSYTPIRSHPPTLSPPPIRSPQAI